MKANIKITALVGIAFLSSFVILAVFLDMYSVGLLTTEKTILDVENIIASILLVDDLRIQKN